jgi:hypothetical protein
MTSRAAAPGAALLERHLPASATRRGVALIGQYARTVAAEAEPRPG